ncbi:MAG: putative transporter solute receptor, DctP family [Ramlibacter sp.]|nr:putative transporter solute receptor, DctP family [Ramlibacter sp.]
MTSIVPSRCMPAIRFAGIVAFALLAFVRQADAEPLTLTFAHSAPAGNPIDLGAVRFARRVQERTNGQVRIEIFRQGQLGSTSEVLEKVRHGSVDMNVASLSYLIKYERTFAAAAMPYLFDSDQHAQRVFDGPAMGWFSALAEKQGFVLLANWEGGFRHLTNNKHPVNRPEDVRGLKIRVPPVMEFEDTMEVLGAQVSKIGFSELYLALSKGVVDGQENPIRSIHSNRLYEVQKHLALTRHAYFNTFHLVSAKTWARLSVAQQQILREESKAAGNATRRADAVEEAALIAKMVEAGVQVTRPDLGPFRAATEPARRKIASFAGDENALKFLRMVDDERNR